jgi:hypothetical protein
VFLESCSVVFFVGVQQQERRRMSSILAGIELNEERFLALLTKLIGESQHLQNNPAQGSIPLFSL